MTNNSISRSFLFKTLCLPCFLWVFANTAQAQFILNGSAVQTSDSCWTLTPDQNNRVGSIWNNDKINLNQSFQAIMELSLGCKDDNGADGIVFGFQPVSTNIGTTGEGMGFQGVSPSLGIEFDTWQNFNLGDPASDHVAIIKNGNLNHSSSNTLAGPIQASSTLSNIEDCKSHKLRVNWDAQAHLLEVYFDCVLRLSYTGDIVNEIFNGDPNVYWGFTSATGGANNVHQVCYSYTTFLDGFDDVVICPGGQYQLQVGGGIKYHWSPSTGLSNPDIPNPIAKPEETTTYLLVVEDACQNPFYDTITVFVDGDTVFFDLGLDTTLCEGQSLILDATSFGTNSVKYLWSNGMTTPSFAVGQTGHYAVTVTIDDYCVADDRVNVTVIPLPGSVNFPPDTVLCLEQTITLDASTSIGDPEYRWQDGSTDPIYFITQSGFYEVEISNVCGKGTAGMNVAFEDCRQVYFPNAFSPNDDGINDIFLPFDGGDVASVHFFKIFDRWGGLVFESNDFQPNDFAMGWDGMIKGKEANPGEYAWLAEVEFRDGKVELFEGGVTVVR